MKIKKTSLILGSLLFANTAIAENPFNAYFDTSTPFMEDSDTLIFDGMRVEGAGFSSANDALRVKFDFDYNTLNFKMNKNDIKVYSNIGIFNEEHMVKDALVAQPTFFANDKPYRFDQSFTIETTSTVPFVADLNLQAGHVISWNINNPSNDYSFELIGENIDVIGFGEASSGVISAAYKILADGVYRFKIMPTNALTLTFNLKLYNANNMLIRELQDNDNIAVSFEKNIRDYAKYKIFLRTGDKLKLSKPSLENIRLKLVDNLGKPVENSTGLALIYEAKKAGDYYLFVDNKKGHGGSYRGTASISSSSSTRSKQMVHQTYDQPDVALP